MKNFKVESTHAIVNGQIDFKNCVILKGLNKNIFEAKIQPNLQYTKLVLRNSGLIEYLDVSLTVTYPHIVFKGYDLYNLRLDINFSFRLSFSKIDPQNAKYKTLAKVKQMFNKVDYDLDISEPYAIVVNIDSLENNDLINNSLSSDDFNRLSEFIGDDLTLSNLEVDSFKIVGDAL